MVGRPRADLHAQVAAAEDTTLSLPVADVPAPVGERGHRGRDRRRVRRPGAAPRVPQGALLGPVLGFAGVATPEDEERWPGLPAGEVVGRAGLEQQYDAVLRGINGRQCLYVDPARRAGRAR